MSTMVPGSGALNGVPSPAGAVVAGFGAAAAAGFGDVAVVVGFAGVGFAVYCYIGLVTFNFLDVNGIFVSINDVFVFFHFK